MKAVILQGVNLVGSIEKNDFTVFLDQVSCVYPVSLGKDISIIRLNCGLEIEVASSAEVLVKFLRDHYYI